MCVAENKMKLFPRRFSWIWFLYSVELYRVLLNQDRPATLIRVSVGKCNCCRDEKTRSKNFRRESVNLVYGTSQGSAETGIFETGDHNCVENGSSESRDIKVSLV